MGPVFFLVLDVDVDSKIAMTYPELYKELQKGKISVFFVKNGYIPNEWDNFSLLLAHMRQFFSCTEEERQLTSLLSAGRVLSFKTFFIWILISIYQGTAIMYLGILLFREGEINNLFKSSNIHMQKKKKD